MLALFGAPAELNDPDLFAAVDEIEKRVLPEDDPVDLFPWSIEELAAADGVADIEQRELSSVTTTTAVDFLGRLATVSAYLKLAPSSAPMRCVRLARCCQTVSTSTPRCRYPWPDELITWCLGRDRPHRSSRPVRTKD